MLAAAGYYLAIKELINERGYKAISLKDVDGMKKLLGFPPAPVFMLLSNIEKVSTIPENDCLGNVTQLMVKFLTGQCGAYLEFYEFFEDRVLAGVPDYVPAEVTDGEITVMPAAFGELSEGILNVSKVKQAPLRCAALFIRTEILYAHGNAKALPREMGGSRLDTTRPQLPGLEILLDDVEGFGQGYGTALYYILRR